jgi:hypothetical protein
VSVYLCICLSISEFVILYDKEEKRICLCEEGLIYLHNLRWEELTLLSFHRCIASRQELRNYASRSSYREENGILQIYKLVVCVFVVQSLLTCLLLQVLVFFLFIIIFFSFVQHAGCLAPP